MTTLSTETITLPLAPVGPVSPLPPVVRTDDTPYRIDPTGMPDSIVRGAEYGHLSSLLPYLTQDGYARHREPGELPTVVLDNGILRATFLPTLGGRLASLVHLPTDRELLYRNPVFQPANLALRNAWFSGGVEWNIGTRGHSPTTCSPLHAATLPGPGGTPMLRMWEYERVRGVVFQVDSWLPEAADRLYVHVRTRNTRPDTVPMYWWSNIAVPEDVRALAPADRAFCTSYDGTIAARPVPVQDGVDLSYPPRNATAADYFFDLPDGPTPWIAAVDADGHGLLQASTPLLAGRKLFVWGTSPGGRHWNRWLGPGGGPYAEIQAGLAATQYEHLPMPAGATWSWVESYGPVDADPAAAHADWPTATAHLADLRATLAPDTDLTAALTAATALADRPPARHLSTGTGWGALERRLRAHTGIDWCDDTGTPFPDDTLAADQEPWLRLLDTGILPDLDPAQAPPSYVGGAGTEPHWDALLAAAPGWRSRYHRAVLAHQTGDRAAAERNYRASLAEHRSAWALRGLAVLHRQAGDPSAAADTLLDAIALAGPERHLVAEAGTALLDAGRPADCLSFLDGLDPAARDHGRIRILEVTAALAAGAGDRARALLDAGIELNDYREGEVSLDDLWQRAFPDRPLPDHYNFRMH